MTTVVVRALGAGPICVREVAAVTKRMMMDGDMAVEDGSAIPRGIPKLPVEAGRIRIMAIVDGSAIPRGIPKLPVEAGRIRIMAIAVGSAIPKVTLKPRAAAGRNVKVAVAALVLAPEAVSAIRKMIGMKDVAGETTVLRAAIAIQATGIMMTGVIPVPAMIVIMTMTIVHVGSLPEVVRGAAGSVTLRGTPAQAVKAMIMIVVVAVQAAVNIPRFTIKSPVLRPGFLLCYAILFRMISEKYSLETEKGIRVFHEISPNQKKGKAIVILIALGANLPSRYGCPRETLEAAKAELAQRSVTILHASSAILTDPVPVSDQPKYHNAVIS